LSARISDLFSISTEDVRIRYQDDEGDMITLSNNADLIEALATISTAAHGAAKITVKMDIQPFDRSTSDMQAQLPPQFADFARKLQEELPKVHADIAKALNEELPKAQVQLKKAFSEMPQLAELVAEAEKAATKLAPQLSDLFKNHVSAPPAEPENTANSKVDATLSKPEEIPSKEYKPPSFPVENFDMFPKEEVEQEKSSIEEWTTVGDTSSPHTNRKGQPKGFITAMDNFCAGKSMKKTSADWMSDEAAVLKVKQEKASLEAAQKAAEEKAALEAAQKAAEEKAALEAAQKAAEEKAALEAAQKAAEEKAALEAAQQRLCADYAADPATEQKIQSLLSMGFRIDQSKACLETSGGDLDQAIMLLLETPEIIEDQANMSDTGSTDSADPEWFGEWDSLLSELLDMGFDNEARNREYLAVAKGDIKDAVKELIRRERADRAQ